MPLTWSEFRKGLMREIADTKSNKAYEKARRVSPELGRFASPEALTAWLLHHGKVQREEEDALLRAIIQQYRTDERFRGIWLATLILGLWPSLTWVFQKLWPIAKGVTRRTEKTVTTDGPAEHSVARGSEVSLDEIIAGAIWGALTDVLEDERVVDSPGIVKRLMYAIWKQARPSFSIRMRNTSAKNGLEARWNMPFRNTRVNSFSDQRMRFRPLSLKSVETKTQSPPTPNFPTWPGGSFRTLDCPPLMLIWLSDMPSSTKPWPISPANEAVLFQPCASATAGRSAKSEPPFRRKGNPAVTLSAPFGLV